MDWQLVGAWCCGTIVWLLEVAAIALIVFGAVSGYGILMLYILWIAVVVSVWELVVHSFDDDTPSDDDTAFSLAIQQSVPNKLSLKENFVGIAILAISPLYVVLWPALNGLLLYYRDPKPHRVTETA